MKKTIHSALFLFLVTGMLFTGCENEADEAAESDASGSLEESMEVESNTSSSSNGTTTVTSEPDAVVADSKYKDGSYTQTGSYTSPGGKDSMSVTLTIKDGLITAVSVTEMASNDTSKAYIEMFAGKISSLVVGKSIDSLGAIGAVNGSSLTPIGFNAAVEAIKTQAQA